MQVAQRLSTIMRALAPPSPLSPFDMSQAMQLPPLSPLLPSPLSASVPPPILAVPEVAATPASPISAPVAAPTKEPERRPEPERRMELTKPEAFQV